MAFMNEICVPLPEKFHPKSPSDLDDSWAEKNNDNNKQDNDKDDNKLSSVNDKQIQDNDNLGIVNYKQDNDKLSSVNYKQDNDQGDNNPGSVNYKQDDDKLSGVNYKQDNDQGDNEPGSVNYKQDDDKLSGVNYKQNNDRGDNKPESMNYKQDNDKDDDKLSSVNYKQDDDKDDDVNYKRDNNQGENKPGSMNYKQYSDNDNDKLSSVKYKQDDYKDDDKHSGVNFKQGKSDNKADSLNYTENNEYADDTKGEKSIVSDIVNITVNDSDNHQYSEQFVNIECQNNLEKFTQKTIKDLKTAETQNAKLTEQLSMDNKKNYNSWRSLSREFEKYSEENMDDLFDEVEVESLAEKPDVDKLEFNLQRQDSEAYVVLSSNDVDNRNKFIDNLYKFIHPSEIGNVRTISEEVYVRHLKGVSQDIHNALEKLLVMFSIGYEELDSAEGRDQCYASIEEPFFKPIWKYLIHLIRLSNRTEETALAFCMTNKKSDLPESYGVSTKLCLASNIEGTIPFQSAVNEIRRLKDHYTMLSKLECVVNVCRLICNCVENFYTTKQIEDGDVSSTPCVGADDLLPILTYVVVKSGLPQLLSECQAMAEFIAEGYIMGEEGYCLTSLQTAISFLSSQELQKKIIPAV